MEYLSTQEACKRLGVSDQTLRNWARAGRIDHIITGGNQRRYNVDSFMREARQRAIDEVEERKRA